MSQTFSIGSFVKINPDSFGLNPKFDDMYGDLGYVGVFMHFIWEVVKLEKDTARGEIAYCRIKNPDVLIGLIPDVKRVVHEGEAVLLVKDLVPASSKTTLVYLVDDILDKQKQEEVTKLFEQRKKLRGQGKAKESPIMKANWKAIESARAGGNKVKVILPKQKMYFIFDKNELPKTEEAEIKFKAMLASRLRASRNERKNTVKDVKIVDVFGVAVQKQGGVFTQSGSLVKAYEESLKSSLDTPKKPVDKSANYIGIEIEFVYRGDATALRELLIKERLHRFVDITTDGSLQPCHNLENYKTLEMRVICKNTETGMVMAKLAKVFANPKVDGYANRSCGLHVHVDMRNRDVSLAYKNLVRIQNILRGAQPVGRVQNKHCKPNSTDIFSPTGNGPRDYRYSVVNSEAFKKHVTLEVRIHEGTTNCEDIFNWAMFIDAIASHTTEIPVNKLTKASELMEKYAIRIPEASIKYVDSRIEKFDSLSVG